MANQFEIYKCELCGNVIEVLFAGSGGPLSCCGQPMKLMADKAIDGAKEKHVPVIEANGAGCKVKVGSAPHVMEETHWIEWIEIATADGKRYKKFLEARRRARSRFLHPGGQSCFRPRILQPPRPVEGISIYRPLDNGGSFWL